MIDCLHDFFMKGCGYMQTGHSEKIVFYQVGTGIGKFGNVAGIKHDHNSLVCRYLGIGSTVQESRGDQGKVMGTHGMYGVLDEEFLRARKKIIEFIAVVRMGFGHSKIAVTPQLVYKKQRRIIYGFFMVWIHFEITFPVYFTDAILQVS